MVSAWSIGTSKRGFQQKNDTPGPAAYYPQQYHNKKPQTWKIGTENTRNKKPVNKVPGPGQYSQNLSKSQTLRKFPEYVFGVKNYKTIINDTPGPGQYNQDERKIRGEFPQYTFGNKTDGFGQKYGRDTPGPAQYQIDRDVSIRQRPSSKIGTANRKDLYETNYTPGVGNYNVNGKGNGPIYSFGQANRTTNGKKFGDIPGPGTYNSRSQLNETSKTIGVKIQDVNYLRSKKEQPGPSDYDVYVGQVKKGNTGVKIGNEQRTKMTKEMLYKPGPNQYRPYSTDKKRPATYKIGTEKRGKILNSENPGPGTYDLGTSIGSGKKYVIGQKTQQKQLYPQPGPADYLQNSSPIKVRPSSCKIGSSNRTKFEGKGDTPGPGTYYNLDGAQGPYISFGRQVRGENQFNQSPGPGTYQIQPKFADVPSYLIQSQSKLMV